MIMINKYRKRSQFESNKVGGKGLIDKMFENNCQLRTTSKGHQYMQKNIMTAMNLRLQ